MSQQQLLKPHESMCLMALGVNVHAVEELLLRHQPMF
jgi:hypothetical protein